MRGKLSASELWLKKKRKWAEWYRAARGRMLAWLILWLLCPWQHSSADHLQRVQLAHSGDPSRSPMLL